MTRKGGLKEVMRGINGGIKRLIKLLTMKYYYHCFINKPKVHIPQMNWQNSNDNDMAEEKPCILSLSAEEQAYSANSRIEEEYEQIELIDELELSFREKFTLVTSHINGKYNFKLIM